MRDTAPIVLSANTSWNIVHFRRPLVEEFLRRGERIVVLTPRDEDTPALLEMGAEHVHLPLSSSGTSPLQDVGLLMRYLAALRRLRPKAYLGFTIKPNIYGSLAAHALGAQVINNISGLGTAFIKEGLLTRFISMMYKVGLRKSSTVFFQNRSDMDLFLMHGLVRSDQAQLLPGSGINLAKFKAPERMENASAPGATLTGPGSERGLTFLLVARLLWDKGVGEYVEAARLVRRSHPGTRFQLLGQLGADNRTAVSAPELQAWLDEGVVEYLGAARDVRPHIHQADCIVLPSYREGLPRALLEGSAMGKPLIATDVPGCRDVVVPRETGLACTARSADALAAAFLEMIELGFAARQAMGRRGRQLVEAEFCESKVVKKYVLALGRS